MAIFKTFFFRQFRPGKCLLRYSRSKKRLSRLWKPEVQKVEKWTFFHRAHGFGPKMAIFPTFFFFANIGQENVFYDILERKNAFLRYENKKFEKLKNLHFTKGFWNFSIFPLVFLLKWPFFQLFFFGNIGKENVYYDIPERKNAFLGYKNNKFKKSKN